MDNQLKFSFGLMVMLAALLLPVMLAGAPLRVIIDTDAACERDDQHAIAYALLSPEYFAIEGFTSVHNGQGTSEKNFLEIHHLLGMAGARGIPVFKGADRPLPGTDTPVASDAVKFIIERSKAAGDTELVVLGIGAATNLASAILLDPGIADRVTFAWLGGVGWPDGDGDEHNMMQDLAAARVLFSSGVKLLYIPCGNNVLFQTKFHSARALRGVSPLGDYLHLLMMTNRWPMDEPFNLADLTAVTALAHPEMVNWLDSPAPSLDERGNFDFSKTYGPIKVATGLAENVYGGPVPLWDEFYGKVADAAPEVSDIREELCRVLNVHPDPPGVQAVEGEVERFEGYTRQEVRWPTIFGEWVPAYLCRPVNAKGKRLPAVICLSGTGGDRIVLTRPDFGIGEYVSIGRTAKHNRMIGWAAELARRGYVTLAMTQRGLGDRGRTGDKQSKAALIRGFTSQGIHTYEIRQALTYLAGLEDVDPQRIGCTGMSFGGITTFYTTAVDRRFAVAAPLCGGIGTLRHMLEIGTPGYHGHYWWLPRILQHFDMPELVASQSPRPYFIAAPLDDIGMPKEGVSELLEKVRPVYKQAGVPDALVAFRPPGKHSFTRPMFEELVKFFDKWL
ncbi:MAG: prolyl oligopeptidase family serine peptidase [Candidatus Glassbacteria bacterium]|nr:prolyl oligopeptidase family serine peptidase [Candidatus Glassbacteria bacterium]